MNRRGALAALAGGVVFPSIVLRGSRAAAQPGAVDRMTKWAYNTEGFERIVHRIDGVETVAYAIGEGDPLVYFHGGGTWHGFEWVRPLASEFRVYCPYHPNFGESGDAPFSGMADYVSHYELLFPALGLDTFHLSGASMGGHLAARYAAANPGDIEKLVLVSPAGLRSGKAEIPDWTKIDPRDMLAMFVADVEWARPYWPLEPSPEWLARNRRESGASMASREDVAQTDGLLREGLRNFDRPVLLLWGQDDKVVPTGFAEEWQAVLPDARLEVIPGGSHLLLDEFPAAVDVLRSFLRG